MEASRQDPDRLFAENPDRASVRAIGDRIQIESLSVTDPRAAQVVRERAEAGTAAVETVAKAIEIGARVIDSESTATNVDYVQRAFEERVGKLGQNLSETLDEGSSEIARHIADKFDVERTDSVQGQIKTMLVTAAEHQRGELLKALTAQDQSNPLFVVQAQAAARAIELEDRHRKELAELRESLAKQSRVLGEGHTAEARRMQAQVAELKEQLSVFVERSTGQELLEEAEAAGTRKGFSFEERVFEFLESEAGSRGDCATHTGAQAAEGGGKKGDVLIEIGASTGPANGRIVFEVKDRKLSKNDAWTELNAAMAARAASFGVLVVAGEDRVPAGREQLHEYEGNKLIVAVDRDEPDGLALAIAYRLAAARVAMSRGRDLTVDASEVRSVTEEAVSCLKQAQAIRTALTGIKNSSDKARGGLDEMVAAVQAKLDRIDSLVAEAADEAASDPDGVAG